MRWADSDLNEGTGFAWVAEHGEALVMDDIRVTPRFREDADAGASRCYLARRCCRCS